MRKNKSAKKWRKSESEEEEKEEEEEEEANMEEEKEEEGEEDRDVLLENGKYFAILFKFIYRKVMKVFSK